MRPPHRILAARCHAGPPASVLPVRDRHRCARGHMPPRASCRLRAHHAEARSPVVGAPITRFWSDAASPGVGPLVSSGCADGLRRGGASRTSTDHPLLCQRDSPGQTGSLNAPSLISPPGPSPSATSSPLRSSYLGSMAPWLGTGELLTLAACWAPDDAGTGSSSPFPGVCAFRLTVPFGADAPYSLAASPFAEGVVAGPPLRAPRVPGLLTWLADQWPGMCAMPRECARGRRRVGRWGRRWLLR
jgi:hypothetical protein